MQNSNNQISNLSTLNDKYMDILFNAIDETIETLGENNSNQGYYNISIFK